MVLYVIPMGYCWRTSGMRVGPLAGRHPTMASCLNEIALSIAQCRQERLSWHGFVRLLEV